MIIAHEIQSIGTGSGAYFLESADGTRWPITQASYLKLLAEMVTIDDVVDQLNKEAMDDLANWHDSIDAGFVMA